MTTKMISFGDDLALIIDRTLLEQLGINLDTLLEVTIEGNGIVVRPVESDPQARFLEAARRVMDIHDETLRKLAL